MSGEMQPRLAAGSPEESRPAQARNNHGVAVVGSLHYDIMVRTPYLPRQGETLIGSQWWWKPGGKGGNQAMAAARHGAAVEMIGALGADDFGAKLRGCLAGAGVGLGHIREAAGGTGMSVALVEDGTTVFAEVEAGRLNDACPAQSHPPARCEALETFGRRHREVAGHLHLLQQREHVGKQARLKQHARLDLLRLGVRFGLCKHPAETF